MIFIKIFTISNLLCHIWWPSDAIFFSWYILMEIINKFLVLKVAYLDS
jgi:hypothetical protein